MYGSAKLAGIYPEHGAGDFTRFNGTVEFYGRVRALVDERSRVLDFGAGRGAFLEDPGAYRRRLQLLRGDVAEVIGADVDPAVQENPALDRAVLLDGSGALPLPDASIDVVVSNWVFEHVRDPMAVAAELTRVLRPGGWICARTPNRWGLHGLATRAVPNRLHTAALRRLQPDKKDVDTFPTAFRLNDRRQLRRVFPAGQYDDFTYSYESEPAYVGTSRLAVRAVQAVTAVLPPPLRSTLMVFLRKSR